MLKLKPFIISLLIPLAVGGLAALLIKDFTPLYQMLNQPPLSPPGWVFPVVWTVLYVLMGIASYLVWMDRSPVRREALVLYGVQLFFNFFWSLIFFRWQNFALALFWLAILLVLILLTTARFFKVNPTAGWLMVPYLIWVAFAMYLNAGVLLLN